MLPLIEKSGFGGLFYASKTLRASGASPPLFGTDAFFTGYYYLYIGLNVFILFPQKKCRYAGFELSLCSESNNNIPNSKY